MHWVQFITVLASSLKLVSLADVHDNQFLEPNNLAEILEFQKQKQEVLDKLLTKFNKHFRNRSNAFSAIPWEKVKCKRWPEAVKSKFTKDWTADDLQILLNHMDKIKIKLTKDFNFNVFKEDPVRMIGGTYSNVKFDQFCARYELESHIGSGGFSFVIKSKRKIDSVDCAVKCIFKANIWPIYSYDHPIHGTVSSEIYHLERLNHPKIIKIFDYVDDGVYGFLVTELFGTCWDLKNPQLNSIRNPGLKKLGSHVYMQVTQHDLHSCIGAHERLPDATIQHIFTQIYEAVCFLPERGICHGDLKCDNVLVDADYQIKLIDFGLARKISRDASGAEELVVSFSGTKIYTAPEKKAKLPCKLTVAEVWSLGVILCFLKTRNFPFPPLINGLPDKIRDLISKMLAEEPEVRITMDQIANHPWLQNDSAPPVATETRIVAKNEASCNCLIS